MSNDGRHSVCQLIQWKHRQIECTRRFVPPKHVDGEHCLLLTRFRKPSQSGGSQLFGIEDRRSRTCRQGRSLQLTHLGPLLLGGRLEPAQADGQILRRLASHVAGVVAVRHDDELLPGTGAENQRIERLQLFPGLAILLVRDVLLVLALDGSVLTALLADDVDANVRALESKPSQDVVRHVW